MRRFTRFRVNSILLIFICVTFFIQSSQLKRPSARKKYFDEEDTLLLSVLGGAIGPAPLIDPLLSDGYLTLPHAKRYSACINAPFHRVPMAGAYFVNSGVRGRVKSGLARCHRLPFIHPSHLKYPMRQYDDHFAAPHHHHHHHHLYPLVGHDYHSPLYPGLTHPEPHSTLHNSIDRTAILRVSYRYLRRFLRRLRHSPIVHSSLHSIFHDTIHLPRRNKVKWNNQFFLVRDTDTERTPFVSSWCAGKKRRKEK